MQDSLAPFTGEEATCHTDPNAAGATTKVPWPARLTILPIHKPPNPAKRTSTKTTKTAKTAKAAKVAEQGLTTPPAKPKPHICPNAPIRKRSHGRRDLDAWQWDLMWDL
jgi:hypothetical protein